MVRPALMCNRHLLGEHVELHMLVSTINSGKSIRGYLEGLVDPGLIQSRHDDIAAEMRLRNMNHYSPIAAVTISCPPGKAIIEADNINELARRCQACAVLTADINAPD